MAGPSRTCCVSEYCTGVLHNGHPRRFHSLRPISIPFTKNAEEPTDGVHLTFGHVSTPGLSGILTLIPDRLSGVKSPARELRL